MIISAAIETIVVVSVRIRVMLVPEKYECYSKLPRPQSVIAYRAPETMK